MTHSLRTLAIGGALATAAALPSTAAAEHGDRAGFRDGGDVAARVALKVKRANRALDRATDHAEDGETTAAVSSLAAVRKNLASALKAANRRIDGEKGPGSFAAVARAQDNAAQGSAELLDEAGDDLTSAAAATLDAALDGQDAVVAAVSGKDGYGDVLAKVAGNATGQAESFNEGLEDDTLTADGRSALEAAATQANATATAAQSAADAADASSDDGADGERGDCPGGDAPDGQETRRF